MTLLHTLIKMNVLVGFLRAWKGLMADPIRLYIRLELLIRRVVAKQVKDGTTDLRDVLLEGLLREQREIVRSPIWN